MFTQHRLPAGPVIAGYTNQASVATLLKAVDNGVNVLIWSFIELTGNVISDPVQGCINYKDLAGVHAGLRVRNKTVTHLVSIGGWGAPHPDTSCSGAEWWALWLKWNDALTASVNRLGGENSGGMDGVDLDAEGADDKSSPSNHYPPELIHLCGTFAAAAKQDGYLSTMVPPQSYLDSATSAYDPKGSVQHADLWEPTFTYHGLNTYAPLLVLYGESYDLVIVQVYEGWSRAGDAVLGRKEDPQEYLIALVDEYTAGWEVDFQGSFGLTKQKITVPASKLVIGLSNGWATPPKALPALARKMLYIDGDAAGKAYAAVGGLTGLRGFGYWDIKDDDDVIALVPKLAKHML